MATTDYPVNHPLAVKLWSKKLTREAITNTYASKFMGTGSGSMIQIKSELSKSAGDRVRVGLRMALDGDGIAGDGTLEGNEEALVTYTDDLLIDQLRHAVRSDGKMSEKRVHHSIREEARAGLQDWWAERIDEAVFNQLGGNSGVSDLRRTGSNTAVAFTSSHVVYPDSDTSEADVASSGASSVFNLNLIDACVEKAKTLRQASDLPILRPLRMNGMDKYVIFLHPYQVYDLRTSTTTGQWLDIQKAAMQGGQITKNPIYTGALGEYNGVILHETERVPSVTANVRRAIFCGAQAGCVAFGANQGPSRMSWVEERFDYSNQLGVASGMIWGVKKLQFNSNDYGVITVPTYAVAH